MAVFREDRGYFVAESGDGTAVAAAHHGRASPCGYSHAVPVPATLRSGNNGVLCPAPGVRHTRSSVLAALRAARISVIGVSLAGGLDRPFGPATGNSWGSCTPPSGGDAITAGQGTSLTDGTLGIMVKLVPGTGAEFAALLGLIDALIWPLLGEPPLAVARQPLSWPRLAAAGRGSPRFTTAPRDSPWLPAARRGSRWLAVARGGSRWLAVARGGSPWLAVARRGSRWLAVARGGSPWLTVARGGSRWLAVARRGSRWLAVARRGPPRFAAARHWLVAAARASSRLVVTRRDCWCLVAAGGAFPPLAVAGGDSSRLVVARQEHLYPPSPLHA